jgi:putative ABC transport system permease protein
MKATAGSPAVKAAVTGLTGRRVQAIVIGLVVLVSTAASTLALGLLVDSNAPFDHAFATQRGSHVTATVNAVQASSARLAATTRLPGVTAASGPFPETTVTAQVTFTAPQGPGNVGVFAGPLDLVGRAWAGGPVDDLTLTAGRWARQAGEVVWSGTGHGPPVSVGARVTVSGVPGSPRLTVVGVATSVTGTAEAWVTPAELAVLRTPGTPDVAQMLYRFSGAGTTAAVSADIARLRAARPARCSARSRT